MPSLKVAFTGDATQLKSTMDSVGIQAQRTASRVSTALTGTSAGYRIGGGSMEGHGGRGGVIGESVMLMREMGRGNFARVPGSMTILAQRMGALKYLMKDTSLESERFAENLAKLSFCTRTMKSPLTDT